MKTTLATLLLACFAFMLLIPTTHASSIDEKNTDNLIANSFDSLHYYSTYYGITTQDNPIKSDISHIALYLPGNSDTPLDYGNIQSTIRFNGTEENITHDLQDINSFAFNEFVIIEVPENTESFNISLITTHEEEGQGMQYTLNLYNDLAHVFDVHQVFQEGISFNPDHYFDLGYSEGYQDGQDSVDTQYYHDIGYQTGLSHAESDCDGVFEEGMNSVDTESYYMEGFNDGQNALEPPPDYGSGDEGTLPDDSTIHDPNEPFDFNGISAFFTTWWWLIALGALFIIGTTKK